MINVDTIRDKKRSTTARKYIKNQHIITSVIILQLPYICQFYLNYLYETEILFYNFFNKLFIKEGLLKWHRILSLQLQWKTAVS